MSGSSRKNSGENRFESLLSGKNGGCCDRGVLGKGVVR